MRRQGRGSVVKREVCTGQESWDFGVKTKRAAEKFEKEGTGKLEKGKRGPGSRKKGKEELEVGRRGERTAKKRGTEK